MTSTQHYVWACGQIVILLTSACTVLSALFSRTFHSLFYRTCYLGAIGSYSIVCYKSLGLPQPNPAFIRRALADENVQYLLLAIYWLYSKPVAISAIPYAIFSLFHVLTFLRSNVLQQVLRQQPNSQGSNAHPFVRGVQNWVKANYDTAMVMVAYTELGIFLRVALGAIFLQNSLLTPVIYAHFLRSRYHQSPFTKRAILRSYATADQYARSQGSPIIIGKVWENIVNIVVRWGAGAAM